MAKDSDERKDAPIVCLERVWAQNEKLVQAILARGWRPVNAAIIGARHLLTLKPPVALVGNQVKTKIFSQLRDQGCRIVRWTRFVDPLDKQSSFVCADHREYGRLAAEHFAERGFRHVAYLGWSASEELAPLYDGLRERASELDMEAHLYDLDLLEWDREDEGGWWGQYESHLEDFRSWLASVGMPIGILCTDDRLAARCSMHCHELGLNVPVDVAILGIGNSVGLCDCAPVPVSSVIPDTDREIAACIDLISRVLSARKVAPEHILCAPKGIALRESTDVLASIDRDVAMALRFIWSHYSRNISVDDIADAVNMPRHQLERAFSKELGRGIGEELRRKRMEVFVDLLTSTDTPVRSLYAACGFFSRAHLFRTFKRRYGMTPTEYRKQNA